MAVATPAWLAMRSGQFQPGAVGQSWLVFLAGEPQYRLAPVPAGGKYSCQVTQTTNGKRLDRGATFPTREDALKGGLEDLRQTLGW
jgi:hypothetical protein